MSGGAAPTPAWRQGLADRLVRARAASRTVRTAPRPRRDAVLLRLADALEKSQAAVLAANAADLAALPAEATSAFRDRLTLNPARLKAMGVSLRAVAALEDPVGEEVDARTLANGLVARRVRSPLGVLLMIFESRPNVAVEAFSLALKSGNVILLRGGKESMSTVGALFQLMREALTGEGLPEDAFWGITEPDRDLVKALLTQKEWIDVVVPRGGDALIQFVVEHSRIPIIKNDRGLCHVYVHSDAELELALKVVDNAKTQRPGVCNAMETLLVHASVASAFLPALAQRLVPKGVRFKACPESGRWLGQSAAPSGAVGGPPTWLEVAGERDFHTEWLDLVLNVKVVSDYESAVAHIDTHGSRHSEAILTRDATLGARFQQEVDAAVVYVNASTRFTDGFELGLGGELGVSTQKLHVRGPVGLRELTSVRWCIDGKGQVRE